MGKDIKGPDRAQPRAVDRVIVLGLLAGAWWALFITEAVESQLYQRDARSLEGPDWDARAPGSGASPLGYESVPAPYPRLLRQARGVGRRRSLDLTRYFQVHGAKAPPEGLYGVGKTTAAAVTAVLRGQKAAYSRGSSGSAPAERGAQRDGLLDLPTYPWTPPSRSTTHSTTSFDGR